MDFVTEKILSYLDTKTLKAAEAVSKSWHDVIKRTRQWETLYQRNKSKHPALGLLLERRNTEGHKRDHFLSKRLLSAHEILKENWQTGNYVEKSVDVGHCSRFLMDSNYIITVDSTLSMALWSRWNLHEGEALPLQSTTTLDELTYFELYNGCVFCSYRNGSFVVWDIKSKSIRHRFQDDQMSGVDLKIYVAHDLIIGFVSVSSVSANEGYQTRFSVRSVHRPQELVSHELTSRIPCATVKSISSDANYFVVFMLCSNDYIVSGEDFKIQLRSINSFEILREVYGVVSSRDIFQYFDGWLVAAGTEHMGVVSIWDIEQGNCRHTIEMNPEHNIVDIQINSELIVIRNISGTFQVYRYYFDEQNNRFLIDKHAELARETIKRGYQKFLFDQLQIITVQPNHDGNVKTHSDRLTFLNFF